MKCLLVFTLFYGLQVCIQGRTTTLIQISIKPGVEVDGSNGRLNCLLDNFELQLFDSTLPANTSDYLTSNAVGRALYRERPESTWHM